MKANVIHDILGNVVCHSGIVEGKFAAFWKLSLRPRQLNDMQRTAQRTFAPFEVRT